MRKATRLPLKRLKTYLKLLEKGNIRYNAPSGHGTGKFILSAVAESIKVKGFMKQKTQKCVILTGYFKVETYGLLGFRMAATIISENRGHDAIVLGVTNGDDKNDLKAALKSHFGDPPMVISFSSLGGRPDLFKFATDMKNAGDVTMLAGPIRRQRIANLPNHSTPLIIHHASGFADWLRQIEHKENIKYKRVGTTIAWWERLGCD